MKVTGNVRIEIGIEIKNEFEIAGKGQPKGVGRIRLNVKAKSQRIR